MRVVRYNQNITGALDLDGVADALVLDADGNTSISAPTDDQIDIEIGGADDFTFTANQFNVLTGSVIELADSCTIKFGTGDDITIAWDGTDLDVLQAAVNSSIKWGISGAGIDHVFYGDTATADMTWDQSADSLIFNDNAKLVFGSGSDVTIAWDNTDLDITAAADNSTITIGAAGNSFDLVVFGSAAAAITFDTSANDLKLEDSVSLMFGTGAGAGVGNAGDVEIRWDATDLDILAAADDSVIKFGNGTNSFDIWLYGNTTALYVTWDASASEFILEDSVSINFGTGLDVDIRWDGTDLDILAAADDSVIKFGNGTNSFDVWVYGNVAGDYVLWDASASKLSIVGAATLEMGGSVGHQVVTPIMITGDTSPTQSGGTYIVNGGTGVTFTLPAVASSTGFYFRVINGVDQTLTVAAPANTMVVHDDVAATSIAWSTAGEKIGNGAESFCDGTLWYAMLALGDDDVTTTVT